MAYFRRFHRNFPCIWIIQPPFCYIAFDFWVFEFFSFSHQAFAPVTVWFALNPLKSKTLDSEKMFLEIIVRSFPHNQQTALWKLEPFLLQNCYFGYWLAFLRMMGHFNVIQRSFLRSFQGQIKVEPFLWIPRVTMRLWLLSHADVLPKLQIILAMSHFSSPTSKSVNFWDKVSVIFLPFFWSFLISWSNIGVDFVPSL